MRISKKSHNYLNKKKIEKQTQDLIELKKNNNKIINHYSHQTRQIPAEALMRILILHLPHISRDNSTHLHV